MEQIYTKAQLKKMKKKTVINLIGFKNIKQYYKLTGDSGKRSKKQFIEIYLMNNQ